MGTISADECALSVNESRMVIERGDGCDVGTVTVAVGGVRTDIELNYVFDNMDAAKAFAAALGVGLAVAIKEAERVEARDAGEADVPADQAAWGSYIQSYIADGDGLMA